ncbi:MAG TPA: peptidylprolyl isomerase [Gaiellaceae bacterium]|jgi:foldase protein PrsA|nr:peptidylprolyl isomerase [Gaiellaceae bacterium]
MRTLRLLAPLALVVLLVAACGGGGGSASKVPTGAVAVVGGDAVTRDTFNGLLTQAQRTYKAQKRTFPKAGSAEYQALQTQAVEFLVQRREFAQRAKDMGISVTDKQVEARLAQIKKQYFGGNEKRYLTQLQSQGLTDAEVHDDIRSQLISEAIFAKVTKDAKVSDSAVLAYYNAHKSQYGQPESRDVRHILVKTLAQAQPIYAHLSADKGSDFATYAKKFSQDPGSKSQGGKLTITKGQTVPAFDKTAFSLATNAISQPVKTQFGYHIIQALSPVRPARTTPLKDVKASISQQLLQQTKNTAMTKWVNDTKKSYCSGSKVRYAIGFKPNPDPCATPAKTTTT